MTSVLKADKSRILRVDLTPGLKPPPPAFEHVAIAGGGGFKPKFNLNCQARAIRPD